MKRTITQNGYTISEHKYRLIYRAMRRLNGYAKETKEALERHIDNLLFYDWPNRDDHQAWIKSASIDEIVSWLI